MKKLRLIICLLAVLSAPNFAHADIYGHDYASFSEIPVLQEGRIKPLDTFARNYLKLFSSRDKLKEISAIEWLAEVLFLPEKAVERKIFDINNPIVTDALGLERTKKHRYSYQEVSKALSDNFATIHPILMKDEKALSLPQRQLLIVYKNLEKFNELASSLAIVHPDFKISNPNLAEELNVPLHSELAYFEIENKQDTIKAFAQNIIDRVEQQSISLTEEDREVVSIVQQLLAFQKERPTEILRVIPPQWNLEEQELWMAPWTVAFHGQGSPETLELLKNYKDLISSYKKGDNQKFSEASEIIRRSTIAMAQFDSPRLAWEVRFNQAKYFHKSLAFYIGSFLIVLLSFVTLSKLSRRVAFGLLVVGFIFHTVGIISRMLIMGRPPVTSLYESIIFVNFVAALFGIILEWRKKDCLGILIATTIGMTLHFVSFKYSAGGDTLGMLVAVLDSNFWLSTHVVTITIGYGCSLVGGVVGHIYLINRLLKPNNQKQQADLYRNMQGITYVALFFAALGTILGGIWADQSWGRFWGWDPKENGALWIVLWLVWLIHGRICGKLQAVGYAAGLVFLNVIVALAWFGVNLLSVGLHSYGFSDGAALNLFIFCSIETLFAIASLLIIKYRAKLSK